jgi:hypothetical protein
MKPPFWAEMLLRVQIEPREEDMIVGDFREEFLDLVERRGRLHAMVWYCRQVATFRSLFTATGVWLAVFALLASPALWMQPFSPVPGVIACLTIVPLAAFDTSRRTGHLRAGLLFGVALGVMMILLGAATARTLHLPSPPLTVVPVLPGITILAFATVGAAAGRHFRHLGSLEY